MARLNRDEFFNRVHERIGTDTSDEAIAFLEDITDTYNDLENRANVQDGEWERKYHELDESWKARYRHRFYSGGMSNIPDDTLDDDSKEDEITPENITIDNLFK